MQYTFTARADNYEVPRGWLRGTLEKEQGFDKCSAVLVFEAMPKDALSAVYILDYGTSTEVRYVAGWSGGGNRIFLRTFPLGVGTRQDGRPMDMSGWMLGPQRAFHLKLREVSE